ncbi:MAG: hypothetical protein HY705_02005 [Gemmatimonadetes bacterium]|nr:hypothetical protein [Gemmatimonadota bacterium]
MKPITLRNLPEPVVRAVREHAARYRISLNRAVIELLERGLGVGRGGKPPTYHDLDHLVGTWSGEEAEEFERQLAEQRKIDPELWR